MDWIEIIEVAFNRIYPVLLIGGIWFILDDIRSLKKEVSNTLSFCSVMSQKTNEGIIRCRELIIDNDYVK